MIEAGPSLDALERFVKEAIKQSKPADRPALQRLLPFLGRLREALAEFDGFKVRVKELEQELVQVGEPPLQYGVFLGIGASVKPPLSSSDGKDDSETAQSEILERLVSSAADHTTSPDERARLQEFVKNIRSLQGLVRSRRDLVVGVHGQRYEVNLAAPHVSLDQLQEGQEVVLNKILNVVGIRDHHVRGETAEVVNVISPAGTAKVISIPDQGESLLVQWAGADKSERFEVACAADLRHVLHRGDIVQVDEKGARATAKVKPRLHVRSGGSEGIVVEISGRLFEQGVDIGDIVRVDTHLQFAYEKLPSYETGGLALEEVPDVTFDDIGGLDDQIEEIRDAIELPYLHRKLFEEYHLGRTKGIMLFGPPGCGKTMIAKAIANSLTESIRDHLEWLERRIDLYLRFRKDPNDPDALAEWQQVTTSVAPETEAGAALTPTAGAAEPLARMAEDLRLNDIDPEASEEALHRVRDVLRREGGIRSFFLNVKGPELLSKWVGESEHRIRKIFEEAKRSATFHTPVIVFFDEMESMFRARGSGRSSDVETTIVPQFLAEMDGVEASENVIIIGASNRQDMIDPAVMRPGRLDVKIKVDRPGREGAMAILALHLTPDLPLRADGLRRPPETLPRSLTFKAPIVKRTLRRCGGAYSEDRMEQIIATIPQRQDVRLVLDAHLPIGDDDGEMQDILKQAASREQVAEAMITETVELLFSPASKLEAVTSTGKHHVIPLRQFVSGALLAGVVSRAKKGAVKRRAAHGEAESGLSIVDLQQALREEFEESAEQLATTALERELAPRIPGQPGDSVQFVQVHLGTEEEDPWSMEKPRPYRSQEQAL